MVKKSDLKSGMLVDIVDPDNITQTYVVIRDGVAGDMLVTQDGWINLDNYDEYLLHEDECYNIVAVYFSNHKGGWTWNTANGMWWTKEEKKKPVVLTKEEIEERLGYKIKIKEEGTKETKSGKVKYKIIDIGKNDAFYNRREQLIGKVGESDDIDSWENGWKWGHFTFDKPARVNDKIMDHTCFHQVELEEIE